MFHGVPSVTDHTFYNAGDEGPQGVRRVIVPFRRLLRRVLRPIFQQQAEWMRQAAERLDASDRAIAGLIARQDARSDEMQAVLAFGWDYVAMARRLAALEDRIEAMSAREELRLTDDRQLALPFPDLHDSHRRAEAG